MAKSSWTWQTEAQDTLKCRLLNGPNVLRVTIVRVSDRLRARVSEDALERVRVEAREDRVVQAGAEGDDKQVDGQIVRHRRLG